MRLYFRVTAVLGYLKSASIKGCGHCVQVNRLLGGVVSAPDCLLVNRDHQWAQSCEGTGIYHVSSKCYK